MTCILASVSCPAWPGSQAANSLLECGACYPVHPSVDDVAVEIQEEIREMVLFALQPSSVWELQRSTAGFPTLASIAMLGTDPLFSSLERGKMEQFLADVC